MVVLNFVGGVLNSMGHEFHLPAVIQRSEMYFMDTMVFTGAGFEGVQQVQQHIAHEI